LLRLRRAASLMEIQTSPSEDCCCVWPLAKWGCPLSALSFTASSASSTVRHGTINGQERGRLRAVEEDVVPVTFEALCSASELHAVVSESRHQTRRPDPITPTTLHSRNLSSTSECQDNGDGKATLMNGGLFDCRTCDDATSAGGAPPPVCPTIMVGAACPHRFAGRPAPLSLGTHQSSSGRHGKRERAARNGMGGVSNGDDFLSPWSELPPWADDLWRTTTGIVQVDAQARARPRTAQHVWVVLGREGSLACSSGGGGSGQSRRQLYLPSSSPPTTG